ncbi:uncharacterized protein LOC142349335 [Convolutriloba macropyga]|uniref:uncharacterized protein LOC142349335 n=1 Tax=Convolutriloba macropyga TaxID=536237 RepID=UPI003F5269AC
MANPKCLKFIVVISSTRHGRMSDRVLVQALKSISEQGHEYTVMDPKELKFPILEMPIHWYPDKTKAPQWLQDAEKTMLSADAFLFVSGEYNRCVPPAMANIIDHFGPNVFTAKAAGIISYSLGGGGKNVGLALTAMIQELGGMVTPAQCCINFVSTKLTEAGEFVEPDSADATALWGRIQRVVKQTAWYASAFNNQRKEYGDIPS